MLKSSFALLRGLRKFWTGGRGRGDVRRLPPLEAVTPPPGGYLISETKAREMFGTWCKDFGKRYSSQEEILYRFNVYRQNLEHSIRQYPHLLNDPTSPIRTPNIPIHGYSSADQTIEEFVRSRCGERPLPPPLVMYLDRLLNKMNTMLKK